MRRLVFLGLLLALPFVAIPLFGIATAGEAGDDTLSDFRTGPSVSAKPTPLLVGPFSVTLRRISFTVSAPLGVSVEVRDAVGAVVRRLGHYSVPAAQRVVLAWNGRDDAGAGLKAGRYAAVVTAKGRLRSVIVRTRFDVRRSARANDADRQSLRQPGNA